MPSGDSFHIPVNVPTEGVSIYFAIAHFRTSRLAEAGVNDGRLLLKPEHPSGLELEFADHQLSILTMP